MGEMPANRTLSVIAARCQLPRGGELLGETVHFATQPENAKSAVPEGFPRSGEAVEKRSDETDEGAPPAAAYPYPSSGAARHLLPLLSLCDIFPRCGGNLSPRGEGFSGGGKATG